MSLPEITRPEKAAGAIRLVVADDHVTVLEGLVAIISRQADMRVVGQASDGERAVQLCREHHPDIALLDLRMPRLDGVEVIQELRQVNEKIRAIVLTTFDTDADIAKAVRAGAKGYLLKDAPREEILACIRRVHAGETCIPAALVAKLAAGISSEPVTPRELDVLTLLSRGLSNKEISSRLSISETTVKAHLRAIFTKLNVLSRTEAIAVATRRGLVQL
ncbi:MAG: response regulator transcription factor [Opitutaceae bacterium]|nr:response regulator transcription factor [Opitutaceae bacterium]